MILCAGEALVDMLPRESREGEMAFAPKPGGAVYNTAIALGRLGAAAGFFCPLSDDLFGHQLRAALDAAGVDHSLSPSVDRPSTLAFVTLRAGQAQYAFYDRDTALRGLTEADLPALPNHVRALFLGGISLVGEPCGTAFEALLTHAGSRLVMLDPNIRPGFIQDEPAYRARLARMVGRADVVKLSDEDLHWLEGPGEIGTLAEALRARGPRLVIITQGAEGVTCFGPGQAVHVQADRVEVVDTVGAGDTFNAGFLAGLETAGALSREATAALPDDALRAALSLGVRAAAVTVSRAGANSPWAHEI